MTMVASPDEPPEIGSFEFYGDTVTVITNGTGNWAVLGQLCQNLAIDAEAQRKAILRKAWSKGRTDVMEVQVPGDVQRRPQFLIHERVVPMWLANITTSRIADEDKRAKVEKAQVELAEALYRYVVEKAGRPAPESPRELSSTLGLRPAREQAEVLVILGPLLPPPYVTATAKIIMARAMGERPELEPSETPLYASTFLAEKGHRPATVVKFQSGFGSRVSNRFFKVHGRRPEKVPGPAGSRIDKVALYSEDDRPLLEQVYSEIADLIRMFETGGQEELSA